MSVYAAAANSQCNGDDEDDDDDRSITVDRRRQRHSASKTDIPLSSTVYAQSVDPNRTPCASVSRT